MNSVFSSTQRFLITWLLFLVTIWFTVKAFGYFGELIVIVCSAALIAFLLNYAVAALSRVVPRSLAVLLVYLSAISLIVILGVTLLPPVVNQARQLYTRLPDLIAQGQQQLIVFGQWASEKNLPIDFQLLASQLLTRLQEQAQAITSRGVGLVLGTFNWLLDFILVVVISFYMLLDGNRLWDGVTNIFAPSIRESLTEALEKNLNQFITGQLLLGAFMAATLTLAFFLLRVPFFLLFAVFIGAMELLPFIGATLGIGAVVIIVAFINWWLALEVLAISVIIQQIKDNFIAPRILGDLTGLSPVVIFLALLIGAKIGGLLGVILAIPLTGVIKALAQIVGDPNLPPQTGAFFVNPFSKQIQVISKSDSQSKKDIIVR